MLAHKKKKIEEMSKGIGQMIQLIVTIIHDPKLIVLDEPFSDLDPVNTEYCLYPLNLSYHCNGLEANRKRER